MSVSRFDSTNDVRKMMIEDLARSGIKYDKNAQEHFEALSEEMTESIVGTRWPSMGIVYYEPDGEIIDPRTFCRVRFLFSDKPTTKKGDRFGGPKKPESRYSQPEKTLPRIYYPPNVDWKQTIGDPTIPLFITEGEKKAYKACAEGFHTIALGGVWAWRSKKKSHDFLPELERIAWEGRQVNLVFDNDVAYKDEVKQALAALTMRLEKRGALVFTVDLPEGGHKGLDDVLVHLGKKGFEACLQNRHEVNDCSDLDEINKKYAIYQNNRLYDMENRIFSAATGANSIARLRMGKRTSFSAKGVAKETYALDDWMEWKHANVIDRFVYKPEQRMFENGEFNLWKPYPIEPEKGDVSLFYKALESVFQGDAQKMRWFEQWCAYPFQNPQAPKMFTAVLLWSRGQGTGKSSLGYFLKDLYGDNASEVTHENLTGSYDYFMSAKQFVLVNEASGAHRWGGTVEDKLKNYITSERVTIRKKYEPDIEIENAANFMFTSNRPDALSIPSADRRFFVHEIRGQTLSHPEWAEINDWRKSEEGRAAMMYHFTKTVSLRNFDALAPAPDTEDRRNVVMQNRSDEEHFCSVLIGNPAEILKENNDRDIFNGDQLHMVMSQFMGTPYRHDIRRLTKALRETGAFSKQICLWVDGKRTKNTRLVWCIRNVDKWRKMSEQDWSDEYTRSGVPGQARLKVIPGGKR